MIFQGLTSYISNFIFKPTIFKPNFILELALSWSIFIEIFDAKVLHAIYMSFFFEPEPKINLAPICYNTLKLKIKMSFAP